MLQSNGNHIRHFAQDQNRHLSLSEISSATSRSEGTITDRSNVSDQVVRLHSSGLESKSLVTLRVDFVEAKPCFSPSVEGHDAFDRLFSRGSSASTPHSFEATDQEEDLSGGSVVLGLGDLLSHRSNGAQQMKEFVHRINKTLLSEEPRCHHVKVPSTLGSTTTHLEAMANRTHSDTSASTRASWVSKDWYPSHLSTICQANASFKSTTLTQNTNPQFQPNDKYANRRNISVRSSPSYLALQRALSDSESELRASNHGQIWIDCMDRLNIDGTDDEEVKSSTTQRQLGSFTTTSKQPSQRQFEGSHNVPQPCIARFIPPYHNRRISTLLSTHKKKPTSTRTPSVRGSTLR